MLARHLPVRIAPLFLAACANTVDGTLGGGPVQVRSAIFVQEDFIQLVDGDSLMVVSLTGPADGCALYQAFLDDAEDAASPEEYAAIWAEHMPEEHWLLELTLRVPDPSVDLGGQTLTGLGYTQWVDEPNSVVGVFTHYVAHLDEDFYAGRANWESYYDYFLSDGGQLTVDRHRPGEQLSGRFDTTAVEPGDGAPAGELSVLFDAERCMGVERYTF